MTQAYPYWEMCLVDDGSTDNQTIRLLKEFVSCDSRLKLELSPVNKGICHTTNRALKMAQGEYVAFLDHDDRLSPDALYHVVETIRRNSHLDILYSDCDMLSPRGLRFMHLFKTDWSPELLFSFNYICHFMVYRRQIVETVGGMHAEFEGSQDYDLMLRAAELNPSIHHIPRVLYHWRQHEQSVALDHEEKRYVWEAGVRALQKTLERRGLKGEVYEISDLWRGNYRVRLRRPSSNTFSKYSMDYDTPVDNFTQSLSQHFKTVPDRDSLIVLGPGIHPEAERSLQELVSWFQIPEVGIVTGKVLDDQKRILHAGLVHRKDGIPLSVFEGFPDSTLSYMGTTALVRNVSSPHPACFAIRRSLWDALEGLNPEYTGPHAILDLALRAFNKGFRIVYTPFARFVCKEKWLQTTDWPDADRRYFAKEWASWLSRGDPYYNRSLTLDKVDMGLDLKVPV
jgi:GT2 family glycosyltransferase